MLSATKNAIWMVMVVGLGCQSKGSGEGAPEPAPKPNEAVASQAAPQGLSDDLPNDLPDDLPDDLVELAEMPALTAEATPEEIDRRMSRSIDALSAFLELIAEHSDCDRMGASLDRFTEANKRVLRNLKLANANAEIRKKWGERIASRGAAWMNKLAANLQKCATHPKVVGALMQLSKMHSQR